MNSFNFKEWLDYSEMISENIVVKYYNEDYMLFPAKFPTPIDIYLSYKETGFSNYAIYAYKAEKEGYVSLGERATHVGIIKNDPIEAGSEVEFGFLNSLIQELAKSGLKPIPYREKGSFIDTALKQAKKEGETVPEVEPVETGFTTGQSTPEFEFGQEASHQITPGVTVSRAAGSWAQFFQTEDAPNSVKKIIECVKKAADSWLKKDHIDEVEIVDRVTGKRELLQSVQGKNKQQNWELNASKKISQLKYLAGEYLKNAPNFLAKLLNTINTYNLKEIAKRSEPKNFGIPIQELVKFNNEVYNEHVYIRAFLLGLNDEDKIRQLEFVSKQQKDFDLMETLLYYFWQNNIQEFERPDYASLHLDTIHKILYTYGNLFEKLEPELFDNLKTQISSQMDNGAYDPSNLNNKDYKILSELSSVLDVRPIWVAKFDQLKAEVEEKEKKKKEARNLQAEKQKYLLEENGAKYLILGENSWKDIPDKYINWHNEIDLDEFSYKFVEDDDGELYDAAYEKAYEDALNNVEEKESETYGEDDDEVNDDIKYYWDDFINDKEIDEVDENMTDEEVIDYVKNNLKDEFINWKKEQLEKEEEEESWKYEPEADQNDVEKYLKELKAEKLWKDGFVIMQRVEPNEIEITLDKNRWEEFKQILQKTIEYNLKEEDYWKNYAKVSINLVPEGGETESAYKWLEKLTK